MELLPSQIEHRIKSISAVAHAERFNPTIERSRAGFNANTTRPSTDAPVAPSAPEQLMACVHLSVPLRKGYFYRSWEKVRKCSMCARSILIYFLQTPLKKMLIIVFFNQPALCKRHVAWLEAWIILTHLFNLISTNPDVFYSFCAAAILQLLSFFNLSTYLLKKNCCCFFLSIYSYI